MEQLLEYENLVYSIINKYSGFDKDDLYQVGIMGLVQAYKNYNSNFNVKFSSYAYYYILGEVTKYIRENKSIRVSKDVLKLKSLIDKTKSLMTQRLGREPTINEISLYLEIDEEKISDVLCSVCDVKSLDYAYDEDGNEMYASLGVLDNNMDLDFINLRDVVSGLNEEEKELIISRYFEDMTQCEVSNKLGISQVQVSRKESKILEKLKNKIS